MEWPCMTWCLQLLFVVFVVQICGNKGCFQEEKIALLEYKEFLKFHNYSVQSFLSSWVNDPNSDCCTWKRVTCNSSTGHVIHLSLDSIMQEQEGCSLNLNLNLSMFQPLKELKSLDLSSNCFSGLIITEDDHRSVSTLKMLKTLDLSHNSFNWSIIRPLKSLTSLKNLILRDNYIRGDFPVQELSILQNLEMLDVSWNALRNPSTVKGLCNMKTLQQLDLSDNSISGTLSTCLNNLTSLRTLDLSVGAYRHLSFLTLHPLSIFHFGRTILKAHSH
ncbi:hypothetical protein L6164_033330 [Bauhinia variegata]|uniref:Uncharacterized protein n=1 Tax=Bauhinia variegata TaxID=167791 RepID=A0ACB9KRL4_BAUVA|nr:hypothetical protein L6164_033330 [Bauhinia variegata]